MKLAAAALAITLSSAPAIAQLASVGPFVGNFSEGFEGPPTVNTACVPPRIFNNHGDMCTPGGNGCLTTSNWTLFCAIAPHGGSAFFGSTSVAAEASLDQVGYRFGGYFATNSGAADATFTFFDAGGNVIASVPGAIPADCAWHWLGWDVGTGTPIQRVKCVSNSSFGGGFIQMDDLQVDFTPSTMPIAYCTAGTSSHGCIPSIGANSNPSASFASSCNVAISSLEGQKTGIVFYGLSQSGFTPHPWASGSTSFLCVKNPTQRTGVHNTGGTANVCNGTLMFDWNAYQAAHLSALGNPFSAGQKVYLQGWYRDPTAAKTTNLSNALEMTVQP